MTCCDLNCDGVCEAWPEPDDDDEEGDEEEGDDDDGR